MNSQRDDSVGKLHVKYLGMQAYEPVWRDMREHVDTRDPETTPDEVWCVEHLPVFTQGQAGKAEHVLNPGEIPVVASDRGGQVTYHGPGQAVIYPLIDLRRAKLGVRDMVTALENTAIATLADMNIKAVARADAPGVYVEGEKIASLGLRIRKGMTYHGLSVNVDMDLSPFKRINPCGYQGLKMTQIREHVTSSIGVKHIQQTLVKHLSEILQIPVANGTA